MSYNNAGHHITSTIITLQHFATLHQTTLHFLSFTLHYPLIWLNPFTFPIVLFPLPSLNLAQYGYHIPKLISQNNKPLHCPKEPLNISLHLSFLFSFFFYLINPSLHFTFLFTSATRFLSLHFPSLFTFYRLHFPSLFYTFLTLKNITRSRIEPGPPRWSVDD